MRTRPAARAGKIGGADIREDGRRVNGGPGLFGHRLASSRIVRWTGPGDAAISWRGWRPWVPVGTTVDSERAPYFPVNVAARLSTKAAMPSF
jgi:hypothetical protein